MATIANISLKDSANANKTYVPERVQTGQYASWVNRDQGTTIGNKRASAFVRKTTASYEKRSLKIVHPIVDGVTGLVKYTNSATVETKVNERSTTAEKYELITRSLLFWDLPQFSCLWSPVSRFLGKRPFNDVQEES